MKKMTVTLDDDWARSSALMSGFRSPRVGCSGRPFGSMGSSSGDLPRRSGRPSCRPSHGDGSAWRSSARGGHRKAGVRSRREVSWTTGRFRPEVTFLGTSVLIEPLGSSGRMRDDLRSRRSHPGPYAGAVRVGTRAQPHPCGRPLSACSPGLSGSRSARINPGSQRGSTARSRVRNAPQSISRSPRVRSAGVAHSVARTMMFPAVPAGYNTRRRHRGIGNSTPHAKLVALVRTPSLAPTPRRAPAPSPGRVHPRRTPSAGRTPHPGAASRWRASW